jgi:hypothetical protein
VIDINGRYASEYCLFVFLSVCSPKIPYILVQILNSQFLTFQDGRSKKTKVSYNLERRGVDLEVIQIQMGLTHCGFNWMDVVWMWISIGTGSKHMVTDWIQKHGYPKTVGSLAPSHSSS